MKKYVLLIKWCLLLLVIIAMNNSMKASDGFNQNFKFDLCYDHSGYSISFIYSPGKVLFSDDPFFGDSDNWTFVYPTPESWTLLEREGDLFVALNTSSLDPIHPSGNPWTDPDGADGPAGAGGESALGGLAVLNDTLFTNFELSAKIARPGFDASNENYDFGIVFDYIDENNYSYVNVNANPGAKSSTLVKVVDGVGLRGQNAEFWSDDLPTFPGDTLFHDVELHKEGANILLIIDGEEVLEINDESYINAEGGKVGFGSWNDGVFMDDFFVESTVGRAPAAFADGYFGNANNYDLVYPNGDVWEAIFFGDGEEVIFALNTSAIDPVHPGGNPWIDPDGPDGPLTGGSESALGGLAVAVDSVYSDFEMNLKVARPGFEEGNGNYDFAIVFGYLNSDNYSYINVNANLEAKNSTIVRVVDGIGTRGQYRDAWADELPTFPEGYDFHDVSVVREASTVIMTINGNEVLNITNDTFNLPGLIGFGSWNDGGFFDDINVISLGGLSGLANVEGTSLGEIDGDEIIDIPIGTTVDELLNALAFSPGATGKVLDTLENELGGEEVLDSSDFVRVTAENGVTTRDYAILYYAGPSDDTSIDAIFSPFSYDTVSASIIAPDGATAGFAKDKIRPSDQVAAIESVVDRNGDPVDDETTLTDGMSYRITAESGTFQDYPFIIEEPTYPTGNLSKADGIIMDAFFDDWANVEPSFNIELVNEDSANPLFTEAPEEDDLSAYFKATWDEDYLYLYFNITDDVISASNTEQTWQNDGPEITLLMASDLEARSSWNPFFQASTQPGFLKIHAIPDGNIAIATQYGLNTGVSITPADDPEVMRDWTGGVVETWPKEDGSGYEIEMQLPWTALNGPDNPNPVTPEMGARFSINVALNDNDGGAERESILFFAHTNVNNGGQNYAILTLGESVSVKEVVKESLKIYPNPANSRITINHESDVKYITIYNAASQIVHSSNYNGSVDISNLPTGTYFIKAISTENSLVSGKFIKL